MREYSVDPLLHPKLEEEEEEEEEEAPSLCDLPLNDNDNGTQYHNSSTRRSSSEHTDLFEFFTSHSSDNIMSSAEDIIFCGKLVPLHLHRHHSPPPPQAPRHQTKLPHHSFRRRSESLSVLQTSVTRSHSTKTTALMRNSRSLDYSKLERCPSSKTMSCGEIQRTSSVKSVAKGKMAAAAVKPRWYNMLSIGVVQPPTEMELKDIKNRQVRRNPSSMFPPTDGGSRPPANRNPTSKGGGLLRVLSCKDPASVAVATTPYCISQAQV